MENIGLTLEMQLRIVMGLHKHFHIQELGNFRRRSGISPKVCVHGLNHIKTADI